MVAVELTLAVPKASLLAKLPLVILTAPVFGLASPYTRLWFVACTVMGLAQALVIALLLVWGKPVHALGVGLLLAGQVWAMGRLLQDPKAKAPWYNATGVAMYVSGMMITAFALRSLGVMP